MPDSHHTRRATCSSGRDPQRPAMKSASLIATAQTVSRQIAREVERLQRDCYGPGALHAHAYVTEDIVVVTLDAKVLRAERALIGRDQASAVYDMRHLLQQAMRPQFQAIVEHATGRSVRAFFSDIDIQADLAIDAFILGEHRIDMTDFETDDHW